MYVCRCTCVCVCVLKYLWLPSVVRPSCQPGGQQKLFIFPKFNEVLNGSAPNQTIIVPMHSTPSSPSAATSSPSTCSSSLPQAFYRNLSRTTLGATNGLIPGDNKRFSFCGGREMFATWVAWMTARVHSQVEVEEKEGKGGRECITGEFFFFHFLSIVLTRRSVAAARVANTCEWQKWHYFYFWAKRGNSVSAFSLGSVSGNEEGGTEKGT